MSRRITAWLVALCLLAAVGCRGKPPDTSTFPSPYTYPTEGQPPEKEEPR
jgi:hypothetical protein